MLELILNLTNLYGIKELEIYQEELELEFHVKELKNKVKVVNGILLFNTSILKISLENLPKKLKFLHDYRM
jgi:uncharacterized protein YfkK (UPF0435 family)